MAFSILNKRMLENDDIRRIVRTFINDNKTIFTYDQQKSFDIDFPTFAQIVLKDYDDVADQGATYVLELADMSHDCYDYNYILPIIRFEEIKNSSQIISENDDTLVQAADNDNVNDKEVNDNDR